MDKNLLNRLEKLEGRSLGIGDVRSATTQQLEDYLTEIFGYLPTNADLERLIAASEALEESKE